MRKNPMSFYTILLYISIVSGSTLLAAHQEWQEWLFLQEKKYGHFTSDPVALANAFSVITREKPFFFGASTSGVQYEGGMKDIVDKNGVSADSYIYDCITQGKNLPEDAILFWDNYKTIIPKIKEELGITMLRISITWSRVEPNEGDFNDAVIQQYVDIVKTLQKYDIEPLVCFHHYTNPRWFMEKGDFLVAENGQFFVRFCVKMYEALCEQVVYYSTINGAQSYGLRAYYSKDQYPYEQSLQKAMLVTAHILNAHVEIYKSIQHTYAEKQKNNPLLVKPLVGIQTIFHPLDPVTDGILATLLTPITRLVTYVGNIIQEGGVYNFFKTGSYTIFVPGIVNVSLENANAPHSIDFIALNAYANRPYIGWKHAKNSIAEHQRTGSTNYYACPQIIYRAAKDAYEQFVLPMKELYSKDISIIIAENGISTQNETQREWFYKQALISLYRAIQDGYPIIAYLPWTATDCFEWRSGLTHNYGLIEVTFSGENGNQKPIIGNVKPGAKYYAEMVKRYHSDFGGIGSFLKQLIMRY
jgi:beta-glucosidase